MKKKELIRDLHGIVLEDCRYDPEKDLGEVSPNGAIDLAAALVDGFVPPVAEGLGENFNDIEDAASIMGKPHDNFEAIEMASEFAKRHGAASAKAESSSEENQS